MQPKIRLDYLSEGSRFKYTEDSLVIWEVITVQPKLEKGLVAIVCTNPSVREGFFIESTKIWVYPVEYYRRRDL